MGQRLARTCRLELGYPPLDAKVWARPGHPITVHLNTVMQLPPPLQIMVEAARPPEGGGKWGVWATAFIPSSRHHGWRGIVGIGEPPRLISSSKTSTKVLKLT